MLLMDQLVSLLFFELIKDCLRVLNQNTVSDYTDYLLIESNGNNPYSHDKPDAYRSNGFIIIY